ncbi:MAG TPA: CHRD domain-containing protein [Actinomycetota bacterium]|nr:CHRD domain-containing protein [Actinomycetota bacterium]
MRSRRLGIAAAVAGLAMVGTAVFTVPVFARDRGNGAKGNVLVANLTGGVEVPPGDPNASGTAVVTLKPSSNTVCYKESWEGLTGVTASHIHLGPAGVAGPIVVPFFGLALPDTISTVGGCVRNVDPALIKNIHDHPSDYYVNVHDAAFPKGAIRGQLHRPGKHDDTDDD